MKLVKRTVLPISNNIAFKNMQYNTINRGMTAILLRSQIVCIVLHSEEQNDIYIYTLEMSTDLQVHMDSTSVPFLSNCHLIQDT